MTKKGILKSDIKDLKAPGKSLTFDVAGACVQTKVRRFIQGKVERQPFAKRIHFEKKFTRNHQSYIQVQVSGNIHRIRKYKHFVEEFRTIGVIMDLEKILVVIPYPDDPESHKGRLFAHDPSTLVSSWKCKIYIDEDLYVADGKPTSVKLFVGHDSSATVFNLLDLAKLLHKRELFIRACYIQSSTVVVAGYLQGSPKTLNEEHWTEHLNWLPRLKNLDIEVQIRNIKDPTSDSQEPGYKMNMSKNNCLATHVLYSERNKEAVNFTLCTTYSRVRSVSQAACNLPEGRTMKYIPYNGTGVIKRSPELFKRLQKTRMLHS